MKIPIAILAGGLATRLHPETLQIPKSLIQFNGRPFIDYQLEQLNNQGFKDVVLCLGHKSDQIINYLKNNNRFNLNIDFSIETLPLGTGGALKNASKFLGQKFGIMYGDSFLPIDLNLIIEKFSKSQKLALMTIFENRDSFDRSNVKIGTGGKIRYSKERLCSTMTFIDYGFSIMSRNFLEYIPSNSKYDLSDLWRSSRKLTN